MSAGKQVFPGRVEEEVAALTELLRETRERLEALTGEKVVAARPGRTPPLPRPRNRVPGSEVVTQAAMLDALPGRVALLDAEGLITAVNAAWLRYTSKLALHGPDFGVGLNYIGICTGSDGEGATDGHRAAEGIRSVLAGTTKRFALEYPCPSATEPHWLLVTATPLADDPAQGAVVMHLDITEQKSARQALPESERHYSEMLANMDLIAVMIDRAGRVSYCNDAFLQVTGWPRDEVVGQMWSARFKHRAGDGSRPIVPVPFETEPVVAHHESEIVTRSGEVRLVRWSNTVFHSPDGEALGIASIGDDITERKRDQERLRQSEARNRLIVETALDAVVVMDADDRIVDWNAQAEKTFGWTREEVIGRPLVETLVPTRHRKAHSHGLRVFLDTGQGPIINKRIELSALHRDGHEFPVELTVSPVMVGDSWIFISFIRDLTEKKHAEQALENLRRQSELILEAVGEGIYCIDLDGNIVLENPASARLLGYGKGEMAGMSAHATMHHSRADGTPYPVSECPIRNTMHDGVSRKVDDEVFWRADGSSFPVEYTSTPHRNEQNLITGAVVVFRDITKRKENEYRIRRLNRVYAMLSGVHALIVRVRTREELFSGTCRLAVEAGAFTLAWIGIIDPQTLDGNVVAWHGGDQDAVDKIRFTMRDGGPGSERPASRALQQSQPVICNDIERDGCGFPVPDEMLRRGHRSVACFPLQMAGGRQAVLSLSAGNVDVFDDEEVRLLLELTGNISFALDDIDKGDRLEFVSYYDTITGLANRTLFLERVALHMRNAAYDGYKLALFVLDLERFKNINEAFGHAGGDALLKQLGDWGTAYAGDASLVGRIDADHFAVVLPRIDPEGNIKGMLDKALEALRKHPFRINETVLRMAAKGGAAVFPDDGTEVDTLFLNAQTALRNAKRSGDPSLLYSTRMSERVGEKLTLENQLRRALDDEEFVLHYQPKINQRAADRRRGADPLERSAHRPGAPGPVHPDPRRNRTDP